MPGASPTSATFVINREDHTLGNALRYVLMRDPSTAFCGYSMPHPSEQLVNLRLQTSGAKTASAAFRDSLTTLIDMCDHISAELDATAPASPDEPMGSAGAGAGASAAVAGGDGGVQAASAAKGKKKAKE
jgi:DNA-directed RNA polymerase I and III subunit RPAC2